MNKKKEQRINVYNKYGGCCAYCGAEISIKDMQIDHMVPRAHKGYAHDFIEDISNKMPSCRGCNHYKRACSLENFRTWLLGNLHKRLEKQYTVKIAIKYGIVSLTPFDGKFYFEKYSTLNREEIKTYNTNKELKEEETETTIERDKND